MTPAARQILESFEALPEPEKLEVALAILQRALEGGVLSLEDEERLLAADGIFLDLEDSEHLDP